MTEAEYLTIERAAESKSEFFNGEMFAMTGASRRHNLIVGNTHRSIHEQLTDRPCEAYASDMRIKVDESGLYTYPDISVTCENPTFEHADFDTLLNPRVIVEVLSKSTEAYNRGKKFEHYRRIESLREYVLVAQDHCHVERYARQPDNQWLLWETSSLDDVVELSSIDCRINVRDV